MLSNWWKIYHLHT